MSMILSTYHVRFRPEATDVETATIDGYRLEGWSNDLVIFGSDGGPKVVYPREIVQSIDVLPFEGPDSAHAKPYWENLEHCCQTLRGWIEEDLIRFVSLEKLWKGFEEVEDEKPDPGVPVVPGEPDPTIKRGRLLLYTEENRYTISFCPSRSRTGGVNTPSSIDSGYLGAGVSRRKARAGEDWTRGRDLADGEFSFDTWRRIVCDMLAFELIEPVEKTGETIIEIDEEGKVVSP